MSDRFELLTGGIRGAPARQRTLQASLDWSYDLLDDVQRLALARLSVFAGSFELDAAEEVLGSDGIHRDEVLDLVAGLVEQSLLQVTQRQGSVRFRLLETIRVYAQHRLPALDDPHRVRNHHLKFCVGLAARAQEGLHGEQPGPWVARLEADLDDLRAPMDWAAETGDLQALVGITEPVTTTDGVTIGATVHGQGPPLVFLEGVIGEGDIDWGSTAGCLTDGFTCHLPRLRGRGLSGDHPDLSTPRIIEDCLTYVESLGQPTGLVGWSGGGAWALAVAAQSDAVAAVAPFEPGMLSLADESVQAIIGNAVARTEELAAEGNLAAAAKAFAGFPFHDQEIALADAAGYFKAAGRYVPNLLNLLQQAMTPEGPVADDPALLGAIKAPVAVLLGSETKSFFEVSARHVVDHVANAGVHEIAGAGHAGPLTHPETLAEALTEFFASLPEAQELL